MLEDIDCGHLVRLELQARLVRRTSIVTPPDSLYYNAGALFTAGDLQGEEALR